LPTIAKPAAVSRTGIQSITAKARVAKAAQGVAATSADPVSAAGAGASRSRRCQ